MTNQTHTPGPGDNIEGALTELRNKLRTLGASDAKGGASRPEAAMRLVAAAYDGTIDERQADELYAAYAAGIATAAKNNPLVGKLSGDAEQKSTTQQVSKFRQFIKMGGLPSVDSREVIDRAVRISKDTEAAGVKTYPRFDAMLNVARAQIKQPDEALSDETIEGLVCRPETAEKDDMAKLVAAYKAAYKLAETIPMPGTTAACDAYRDAIVEAGGEVPPMTKEEKAAANATEFLRSRGMIAVRAIAAE